jgi:formyl-CoA transferase
VYRPDPRRGGTGSLPFGIFEAAGGTWFVLGITQQFWARFCEVVGRPEWIDDPRLVDEPTRRDNEDLLNGLIEEQMLTADAATWEARFHQARLPGAAVVTVSEAFAGEQVAARDMRVVLDDPVHPGGVSVAGQPVKLSAYRAQKFRPAPVSGADTVAVRAEFMAEPVIG